jgi:replicative DNA helicase
MRAEGRHENRQQEVSAISRGIKALARELNIPILALSQLSRGVEARSDKRPLLSDLRESGSIEQDADVVLFIYRAEVYDENTERRGIADILIAKHRHGPTGSVPLLFRGPTASFVDAELRQVQIDSAWEDPAR